MSVLNSVERGIVSVFVSDLALSYDIIDLSFVNLQLPDQVRNKFSLHTCVKYLVGS